MAEPPFDLAQAHRWFAVEYNNEAWDLLELPGRTPEQKERMWLAAHASVAHWSAVGRPMNELRGLLLLATACIAEGNGDKAQKFAERSIALCECGVEGLTPFDRASALGVLARALRLRGDAAADAARTTALASAAELPPDDRAVFDKLYG